MCSLVPEAGCGVAAIYEVCASGCNYVYNNKVEAMMRKLAVEDGAIIMLQASGHFLMNKSEMYSMQGGQHQDLKFVA